MVRHDQLCPAAHGGPWNRAAIEDPTPNGMGSGQELRSHGGKNPQTGTGLLPHASLSISARVLAVVLDLPGRAAFPTKTWGELWTLPSVAPARRSEVCSCCAQHQAVAVQILWAGRAINFSTASAAGAQRGAAIVRGSNWTTADPRIGRFVSPGRGSPAVSRPLVAGGGAPADQDREHRHPGSVLEVDFLSTRTLTFSLGCVTSDPAMARAMGAALSLLTIILLSAIPGKPDFLPQPKNNIWKTLASSLGQDHICLNAETARDPLSSCLVGIPIPSLDYPHPLIPLTQSKYHQDPTDLWRETINRLPVSPEEPLQFQLLGSSKAPLCFQLLVPHSLSLTLRSNSQQWTQIEGLSDNQWCNKTISPLGPFAPDSRPRSLPQNLYLICENRAWNGIPSRLLGGPCAFGHVSLFAPNTPKFGIRPTKTVGETVIRQKKDLTELGPDCDSKIYHWNEGKRVAVSLFLPWVSAGKAIGELGKLECWSIKQANLTSTAIAGLLADEKITRQATLQNRAALDYLLLLHHHRCEEFEGLCCFNLSSKAQNVQSALEQMQSLVKDIQQETEDWLGNLLSGLGLSGWAGSLLKDIIFGVLIILAVVLGCSIVWAVIRRLVSRLVLHQVNMVHFPAIEVDPEDPETSTAHPEITPPARRPEDDCEDEV
ncbi:uncharacterized protein GJ701_003916 [Geothlypis trichas]